MVWDIAQSKYPA